MSVLTEQQLAEFYKTARMISDGHLPNAKISDVEVSLHCMDAYAKMAAALSAVQRNEDLAEDFSDQVTVLMKADTSAENLGVYAEMIAKKEFDVVCCSNLNLALMTPECSAMMWDAWELISASA